MPTINYHDNRSRTDTAYSDLQFFRTDRRGRVKAVSAENAGNVLYMGVEVENDHYPYYCSNCDDAIAYVRENASAFCRVESDGSLDNGFEIVSAPMTLAAHKATDWTGLFAKLVEMGARAHDTDTCGLHVHVSRAALGNDDEAKRLCIAKIFELVERFQQHLSCFARRDITASQWCQPTEYGHSTSDGSRALRRKAATVQDRQGFDVHDGRRYRAVNLQNPSTIEFRLFKGTLKPDTFYATIALVDGIVRWCKQHTTPEVHTLTWDGLLAWINDDTLTAYWNTRKQYLHRFTAYAA